MIKQIERNLPNFQYDKNAYANVFHRFVNMVEGGNADEICSKFLLKKIDDDDDDDDDFLIYEDVDYVFLLERLDRKILMYFYAVTFAYRRSKRIRRNRMLQTQFINKLN